MSRFYGKNGKNNSWIAINIKKGHCDFWQRIFMDKIKIFYIFPCMLKLYVHDFNKLIQNKSNTSENTNFVFLYVKL